MTYDEYACCAFSHCRAAGLNLLSSSFAGKRRAPRNALITPHAKFTPQGRTSFSYEKEALCDWITKQHRYPGGEARATRKPTHPQCPG